MHNFVKTIICFAFLLQSYSMVSFKDTGWGGRFSDDEIRQMLTEKLYSDFSEICGGNDKVELYSPSFLIVKNEKSNLHDLNDLYDYAVEVEYINPFTDEIIFTNFKVITEVSRISDRLILSYVNEPLYQCF